MYGFFLITIFLPKFTKGGFCSFDAWGVMDRRRKEEDPDGGMGVYVAALTLLVLIYLAHRYDVFHTIGEMVLLLMQPHESS